MRYKANEARRPKIPKARSRVANWPEYDRALQRRGNLTVWVTPEALAAWQPPPTGQRGRPRDGHGDRDRTPAALGLWPSVAADRGPAPFRCGSARDRRRRARPHEVLPSQSRAGARRVAGTRPGERPRARGDRRDEPEALRRGRSWSRLPALNRGAVGERQGQVGYLLH